MAAQTAFTAVKQQTHSLSFSPHLLGAVFSTDRTTNSDFVLHTLKHFSQQGQLCIGVLSAARSNVPVSLQSLSSISVFLSSPLTPHTSNSLTLFLEKKVCCVHI